MIEGQVKSFDSRRGYGFILVDGVPEDIFVHYSVIAGAEDGFRLLHRTERVKLEFTRGQDGRYRATKVHRFRLRPTVATIRR